MFPQTDPGRCRPNHLVLFLALLGVAMTVPTAGRAQWTNFTWKLDQEEGVCSMICPAEQRAKEKIAIRHLANWLEAELLAIGKWYSSMGFRQGHLDNGPEPGTGRIEFSNAVPERGTDASDLFASYIPGDGTIRLPRIHFKLPLVDPATTGNGSPFEKKVFRRNSTSLAHELYHAVQVNTPSNSVEDTPKSYGWISEGMAEAAGIAWNYQNPKLGYPWMKVITVSPEYEFSLYSYDWFEYAAAHFFYFMGADLGEEPRIRYFRELEQNSYLDGKMGLSWLDNYLAGTELESLFEYYPKFVASHVPIDTDVFSKEAVGRPDVEFRPTSGSFTAKYEGEIRPVAADPRRVVVDFTGQDWPTGLSEHMQVYLFVQELKKVKGLGDEEDLSLVVDRDVTERGKPYMRAVRVRGDASSKYEFDNRVTNVAREPWTTAANAYEVKHSLKKVRWDTGECVTSGAEFSVQASDWSDVSQEDIRRQVALGYATWSIEGGEVVDPLNAVFRAGASGDIRVDFVILYKDEEQPVTVYRNTINQCQTSISHPKMEAEFVYDYTADYARIVSKEGVKIYMGEDRFMAYDPAQGGWINMPPSAQAMMQASVNQRFGQAAFPGAPPWIEKPDRGFIARIPWVFGNWWDYRDLTEAMEENPEFRARMSYACAQKRDCLKLRITDDGVTSIAGYDRNHRLTSMSTPDGTMKFRYGNFGIDRPPGWPARVARPDPKPQDKPTIELSPDTRLKTLLETSRPPKPRAKGGGSSTAGSSGGGACDCSCGSLLKGPPDMACVPQCAAKWAQCVPGK